MTTTTNPLRQGLVEDRLPEPCTVVIFGASGDLTKRKLVPALYSLAAERLLPPSFAIVGYARKPVTDEAFRADMREWCNTSARHRPVEEALWNEIDALLPQAKVVVLSDYCKGVLTDGLLRRILERCRRQGTPVLVDPKRQDFSAYRGATVLTPNLNEAALALGRKVSAEDDDAAEAAARLRELTESEAILLTRGSRGMTLCTARDTLHFATPAREVADVTGAGDTVVAMLAVALAEG